VDHAADDVGVAGVDDPAGLLGGYVAVVPEDADHVGDVVLRLDDPLAGVEGLHPRDLGGVALEQVGDPEQQVPALARRGRRPRPVVERAASCCDRCLGVLAPGLVDLTDRGCVGRAGDLPARTPQRAGPGSVDVELWHGRPPFLTAAVAHRATHCCPRNRLCV